MQQHGHTDGDADAAGRPEVGSPGQGGTDAHRIVADLDLESRVRLLSGTDKWHTEGVPTAGIAPIMLADGPHGLRKQPEDGDHLGMAGSVPATCFPTAVTLASSWDPALL